jgi:MATE family multidrug resistance protein
MSRRVSTDYRAIVTLAWPIILANVATPLLGLADTAVIGNTGSVSDLGAIALGALLFNCVYWSFGFLRMGTTGFTAQALGAGDTAEVRATLARALLIAATIGLLLLAAQQTIAWLAWQLFDASAEVESAAARYFSIRIWGAPAALSLFVVMGHLIGSGQSRVLMLLQLVLNGLNIALDLLFAGMLGWNVEGIALGTAIAEWTTLGLALSMVLRRLHRQHCDVETFWPRARIFDRHRALRTLRANADIMLRTLMLLVSFGWFTNQSATFGDAVLGANHILLQLISFGAFFLDGYAFAVESLVGRAIGGGRRDVFDLAVRRSSVLALATALLLAATVVIAGSLAVDALTDLSSVRAQARAYLPWCASYVLLSVAAFQLDGIFIGATATRAMRNAAMLSTGIFIVAAMALVPLAGNTGLWAAFNGYVVLRALSLLWYLRPLRQGIAA